MPFTVDWPEIALRVACAFFASVLIGIDRGSHERPVGMRTVVLVGLAACFSTVSANLMLARVVAQGQPPISMDVLRLPLGILTGMGFIGAAAIVRRDGLVRGVTTAATLWYVTVMGLAFGAGLLVVGGAAAALGLFTLWLMKYLEAHVGVVREANLALVIAREGPGEEQVRAHLKGTGFRIRRFSARLEPASGRRVMSYELWARPGPEPGVLPDGVKALAGMKGVEEVDWKG